MNLSAQWQYIEQVAAARLETNKTERHVSEYGEYLELIGAAGELAARRFFSRDETLHGHFDGGKDLIVHGIRIDVKATLWTRNLGFRFLQWPTWKMIRSDAILMTAVNIAKKQALVLGYALPADIRNSPINRSRAYPCHEIPVRKLRRASRLLYATSPYDLYPGTQAVANNPVGHHVAST